MKRATACAAALAISARAGIADADPSMAALLRVERRALDGVELVLNEVHDYPIVALCLGVEADNRPLSVGLQRSAQERRSRWSSTRRVGGSVDCIELPRTEIAAGFWLLSRRWEELAGISADEFSPAEDADGAEALSALSELRLGVLATEVHEPPAPAASGRVVVTVSGDFSPDQARALAADRVTRWRPASAAPASRYHQTTERLSVLQDSRLDAPIVHEAWLAPPEAAAAIETAITVLAAGDGSRIAGNVIRRRKLATESAPFRFEHAGNWIIGFSVSVSSRTTVDKAHRFVDGAMRQIRFTGPSNAELVRAKGLLVTGLLMRLADTAERAARLTEAELVDGSAELLAKEVATYESVTPDAVREAAKRLLTDERRCMVEAYPPGYPQDDPALEGYELYTVQPADTWSTVSARFGLKRETLARDNDLDLRHRLTPGQVLWVRPKKPAAADKRVR